MANLEQATAIGRLIAVTEFTLGLTQHLPNGFVSLCMDNPLQKLSPFLGDLMSCGRNTELITEIVDNIGSNGFPPRLLLKRRAAHGWLTTSSGKSCMRRIRRLRTHESSSESLATEHLLEIKKSGQSGVELSAL